ncbi:MAG: DUF1616 domain-containing protein [Thermoproteus sp.]|nr:DUF1616 domain-containing protein [Thermoproteus sp.]
MLSLAIYLIWKYRADIIGFLALAVHSKDVVDKGRGNPRTVLFDEDVLTIALAVVVFSAGFLAVNYLWPPTSPYAVIYIVGPDGKFSSIPQRVPVGSSLNLSIGVYNAEGRAVWYVVLLNISRNGVEVANYTFMRILANGSSWLIPFTIEFDRPGNYTVEAQLWKYEPKLTYTNKYVRIEISVG